MMSRLKRFFLRLRNVVRPGRPEPELARELASHLALLEDDFRRRGLAPEDARLAARRAFGGVEQAKERHRDARSFVWVDDARRDLQYAVRMLMRTPVFTGVIVSTLALGIGATTTVFTIVNGILFRGLPVSDPHRVLHIGTRDARDADRGVSYLDYRDWKAAVHSFDHFAAFGETTMNVTEGQWAPERLQGAYVSADIFPLLGAQAVLGREFRADDDQIGAPAVAELSTGLWSRRYGGDRGVLGRTIRINDVPTTIVGVMPPGFEFPNNSDLWQPLAAMSGLANQQRDQRVLDVVGRLADGVTAAEAASELRTIAARLLVDYPDTNTGIQPVTRPFLERYIGPQIKIILFSLLGMVAILLLIACGNVGILLFAQAGRRASEISMRVSLGATRLRVVRQLLMESVLLVVLAGTAGFTLSLGGARLFSRVAEQIGKPYWMRFTFDGRVFGVFAAVCLGAAIVFGLAPALWISGTRVRESFKERGRWGTVRLERRRWATWPVVVEVALSLILLVSAGLMTRSFLTLYRADSVLDTSKLIVLQLTLPTVKYPTPEQRMALFDRLEERLRAVPGVAGLTIASMVPFNGSFPRDLSIEGRVIAADQPPPRIPTVVVGSRYFDTLGLPVIRGRGFTDQDGTPGHESVIVNEEFRRRFFADEDPLGRRIRVFNQSSRADASPWLTVVGVSPTVRQRTDGVTPVAYLPHRAEPLRAASLIVRTSVGSAIVAPLREEARTIVPDLPLFGITTLDDVLSQSRFVQRVFGAMFSIFAAIGLVLSAVGLYAVTTSEVSNRTPEFGIRMALGARASQVCWLVLRAAFVRLCIGLAIGLVGVAFGAPVLQSVLQTGARDPLTIGSVSALLMSVSVGASLLAARRATTIDPSEALRSE